MSARSTSISQEQPQLRRRSQVPERAHSLNSLNTIRSNLLSLQDFKVKRDSKGEDMPRSSHTDYTVSETSDEDEFQSVTSKESYNMEPQQTKSVKAKLAKPAYPFVNTELASERNFQKDKGLMSPTTRAWYEFDLAVVVALVSPIGNWLTGGDHVKNLLLIVLLIFYLHQIIEIPWMLYQKSRPHRRSHHLPPSDALKEQSSTEARYALLAASELRKFELFFLFLTFISPFIGAALLRYGTDILLGPDAVSWFSTGLFVLATGMRPWAHLVERLSERTAELHDFVHYPSVTRGQEQYEALEQRIAHLEKSHTKIQTKLLHASEDVYNYVDDAVDTLEHAFRKQDRKWEKYEDKMKEMEQAVVQLSVTTDTSQRATLGTTVIGDIIQMKTHFQHILQRILPGWFLTSPASPFRPSYLRSHSDFGESTSGAALSGSKAAPLQRKSRPSSGSPSPSLGPTPLETIHEEDIIYQATPLSFMARPYLFTSNIIYRVGYFVTAPLRAIVRMVLRNY